MYACVRQHDYVAALPPVVPKNRCFCRLSYVLVCVRTCTYDREDLCYTLLPPPPHTHTHTLNL